jgi:hypothetical protein
MILLIDILWHGKLWGDCSEKTKWMMQSLRVLRILRITFWLVLGFCLSVWTYYWLWIQIKCLTFLHIRVTVLGMITMPLWFIFSWSFWASQLLIYFLIPFQAVSQWLFYFTFGLKKPLCNYELIAWISTFLKRKGEGKSPNTSEPTLQLYMFYVLLVI